MLSIFSELRASERGEGLEVMQRVLDRLLVVGDHPVDVLQRAADRLGDVLQRVRIGGQHRDAVLIQRNRGRGLLAALQRDRGDAGQALEFEPDQRVLADRGIVLDHGECDDATRVVQLHGDDFAYPDTVEIDAAAVAQARRRAFEDDADRAARLGGVQALEPQHEAERRGDHRQRERSDQDVIRPRFHQTTPILTAPISFTRIPCRSDRPNRFSAHDSAGALAVEIGPQPGMLRGLHVGHRSCRNDLTVP